MNLLLVFSAALLALLMASPALDGVTRFMWGDRRRTLFTWRSFWADQSGVVAITYTWPNTGSGGPTSTAPTAVEMAAVPVQTCQVFFADADAQAVVVHNKNLPNSFPSQLYPIVTITKSLGGASDSSFGTNFTIGKTSTNSITINKIGVGTGSGGTYDVALNFGAGPWGK